MLVLALCATGCDPCSGLTAVEPGAASGVAGEGTRVEVHLPHLGESALKRWRGPDGTGKLRRAARTSDGDLVTIEARPYHLRVDADPLDPRGLVLRGGGEIVVRDGDGGTVKVPCGLRLPAGVLLRPTSSGWSITADPRVVTTVTVDDLGDPTVTRVAEDLAAELIPRILGGRPLLTVAHAPAGEPRLHLRDMSLILAWGARRSALGPRIGPHAAPSVGNTASVAVAAGELVGGSVQVDGPDGPLTATVLAARRRGGGLWTTVRLREPRGCSWVEARLPVVPTVREDRVGMRAIGDPVRLRGAGALAARDVDEALSAGAGAGLGPLRAMSISGPSGAPTRPARARTGGGAVIKEVSLGGLGGGTVVPADSPKARPRPRDR